MSASSAEPAAAPARGRARIGISGWTYAPWRGVFYPPGLPHRAELAYAAARLSSIEVNGSFYSLQRPTSWQRWHDETPDGFVFGVKGPRFVTHMKKLAGAETAVANFLASGLLALGPKLGPLLWQLPPTLGYDAERLRTFLAALPRSTGAAAVLARAHDERMTGRALTVARTDQPLRHALEVRHGSYLTRAAEFRSLLAELDVSLVVADTAGRWPLFLDAATDGTGPVYVRLHGDTELYTSGYSDAALDEWAARCRVWLGSGRDVHVYFDNDVKVRAPVDAMGLLARLAAFSPPTGPTASAGR